MTEADLNGNDATRLYVDAAQAQLGERVTNLGRRQTDLESEFRSSFKQMENSFASFAAETRNAISALSSTISEGRRPQWQALGVALTFAALLGGLAYMPIREATTDLKASVATMALETRRSFDLVGERFVTQKEMEWRTARGAEDRARQEAAIAALREATVTRSEWAERNRARDQEVAELSRRIEEIRAILGSQYTTRDVLLELQEEVKDLRGRIRAQNTPLRP